jgi:hypothetical protein
VPYLMYMYQARNSTGIRGKNSWHLFAFSPSDTQKMQNILLYPFPLLRKIPL